MRRLRHWEFWPPWVWYPPIVAYMAWLAVRHRGGLFLFTAADPGLPAAGGLIGESKFEILEGLRDSPEFVAKTTRVDPCEGVEACLSSVQAFRAEQGLGYPLAVKPDKGCRGEGAEIVRSEEELRAYLAGRSEATLVQEYVPGQEFGVFYVRRPSEERGRIFSVCEKQFIEVTGNGKQPLPDLILADARAVCKAAEYFGANAGRLEWAPAAGERVRLSEIGNHARGCLFLDGNWVTTPELEACIDRISRRYRGFYFGRYDVRTPDVAAFQQGRGFKIIELNGVSSEATDCYDPKHGLLAAYRILFPQWRECYAIAAENAARGARPWTARDVWRLWREHRRERRAARGAAE
jgi:hypothetical protein